MSASLSPWTEDQVLELLEAVKDPEIPVISVVDLGIVREVKIPASGAVEVVLTPTFAGCPAIEVMKADVQTTLENAGVAEVTVTVDFRSAWSSNMISSKGKQQLKEFGLSPPPAFEGMLTLDVLRNALCPRCNSNNTRMMSVFGPTACRSIHHCVNCAETFEQFKPL